MSNPKIVWAEPVVSLLNTLRSEALATRQTTGNDANADLLDRTADRLECAIQKGAEVEYVDTAAAAKFFDISEEGMRARCRRRLSREGKARKRGGEWEIHHSVLAA